MSHRAQTIRVLGDPWDSEISAAPIKRRLLEKDIQDACVTYARSQGYWARKFSSPANRSVPDYLFSKRFKLHPDRPLVKWAEEFKAPKKTETDAQLEEQRLMREAGWKVISSTGTNGQADIDAFKVRLKKLEELYR